MKMNFYLQQGYGMLSLNEEFAKNNNNIGVILSPRSCARERMERHVNDLKKLNANLLFDPQFFNPRTTRENILSYPYWNNIDYETIDFSQIGAEVLCEKVIDYQVNVLFLDKVILPGSYTNIASEEWLQLQQQKLHINQNKS